MNKLLILGLCCLTIATAKAQTTSRTLQVYSGGGTINVHAEDIDSIKIFPPSDNIIQLQGATAEQFTLPKVLARNEKASVYYAALEATGLLDKLNKIVDVNYDGNKYSSMMLTTGSRSAEMVYAPKQKLYGFTAFIVPDSILKERYGITDLNGLYSLACSIYDQTYPNDISAESHGFDHLMNPRNPLYRFMAYHLLNRNVHGYNFLTVRDDAGIDVSQVDPTEWYTTLLPHTMIKVEKLTVPNWVTLSNGTSGDRYINRRFNDKYSFKGVHVQPNVADMDNNAANGIYFYVDDILKFDEETRDDIQNDRIRMDFSTIFPELQTNNMRMNGPATNKSSNETGYNYYFPNGYLDDVTMANDTRLTYWYPRPGYYSMNGDEMDVQNVFDITFKLPPVPFEGDWQIRLGYAPMSKSDGAERGQVQVYINDVAQGLPIDLSKPIDLVYGGGFPSYSNIRKYKDARTSDFFILKDKGYYRGPYSVFNSSNGMISGKYNYFAEMSHTVRQVLSTLHLKSDQDNYIRFVNVSTTLPRKKELHLDYLELVPKSIYGADKEIEDDL